jgi:serine protease inhibitor
MKKLISRLTIILMLLISTTGCGVDVKASNLMKGIIPQQQVGLPIDNKIIQQLAQFNFQLLQTIKSDDNVLLSPLSVMIALTMTANGADNATLHQMQQVLGNQLSIDELNGYLLTYLDQLPSGKLYKFTFANSIWFNDDEQRLKVEPTFLQTNADYFHAEIYQSPFDGTTTKAINNWVATHSDNMIKKIIDEVTDDMVMILLNALVFDAQWEVIYNKSDINDGIFTDEQQSTYNVQFMRSSEQTFVENELLTGFIKPYKDNKYSFVAMLPKDGVELQQLIKMSGNDYLELIRHQETTNVVAVMPKFSYAYETSLRENLIGLGMTDAFSGTADFSRLGQSTNGNIYISDVIHKTFITVNERGTKAGAVTMVVMKDTAISEEKTVTLDRPFLYAIIDNQTSLPLFIGTVSNFK